MNALQAWPFSPTRAEPDPDGDRRRADQRTRERGWTLTIAEATRALDTARADLTASTEARGEAESKLATAGTRVRELETSLAAMAATLADDASKASVQKRAGIASELDALRSTLPLLEARLAAAVKHETAAPAAVRIADLVLDGARQAEEARPLVRLEQRRRALVAESRRLLAEALDVEREILRTSRAPFPEPQEDGSGDNVPAIVVMLTDASPDAPDAE